MKEAPKNFIGLIKKKVFDTASAALFISVLALVAAFWQAWLMRQSMRLDQRAWIIPTITIDPKIEKSKPLNVVIELKNTGKTPARSIEFRSVTTKLKQEESPIFDYAGIIVASSGGLLFPDQLAQKHEITLDGGLDYKPLLDSEFEELTQGAYVVSYMLLKYEDVFGVSHWVTACVWKAYKPDVVVMARPCSDYNDVDDNK